MSSTHAPALELEVSIAAHEGLVLSLMPTLSNQAGSHPSRCPERRNMIPAGEVRWLDTRAYSTPRAANNRVSVNGTEQR